MTRMIFAILIAFISTGLFSSENYENKSPEYSPGQAINDSIFNVSAFTDDEFKKAVFLTIQKNSLTNSKLFLKTLKEVKLGKIEKKERVYGVENITKEFSPGLNGWTITLSGMLVVFVGLILIAITIHVFNYFFRKSDTDKTVERVQPAVEKKPIAIAEDIPSDHVIVIATAIEIYKRLYLVNSMSSLTCKPNDNHYWKSLYRFRQR